MQKNTKLFKLGGNRGMAKPRIFISSTYYDLKHVREDIGRFVTDQGYEPVLFERGEVPYGKTEKPEEYCYKEIDLCDILVSIVGGRLGTEASEKKYSITQKELRQALDLGKQVYIFVEKNVLAEYETYKINKDNSTIKFRHVDNRKVYEFLEEVMTYPRNNPVFGFELPQDIIRILREQWAGLFQRLLNDESDRSKMEMLNTLKSTVSTLQNIVNVFLEEEDNKESIIQDIIIFNHPAFLHVQRLLNINFKLGFTTLDELNILLRAVGYSQLDEDNWDEEDVMEWMKIKSGVQKLFKVRKVIFNEDNSLKPILQPWDESFIRLETSEVEDEPNNDDIPF